MKQHPFSMADMQGGDNESATVSSLITSDLKSLLQMWQIFTKIM